MKKLLSFLLVSVALSAHAAPKNLTSECTNTVDEEGRNIRSCLAPGEAPVESWSQRKKRLQNPSAGTPPSRQQTETQPVEPPPQVATEGEATPQRPPPPIYPQPDNRVRQQFRFSIGGFSVVTPPVVVGTRNQTCQMQCWNRAGIRDCRQYCW